VVLRSKGLRLALVALVLAAVGGGVAYARSRPERIKEPALRWAQTDGGVTVYVHNVNRTWALRDQRVLITLVGDQHNIIRSYGPDEHNTWEGAPGQSIACCLIDHLRPGGDFVFSLWPTTMHVAGVQIELDDTPRWERAR
jgi:hypothetical protein